MHICLDKTNDTNLHLIPQTGIRARDRKVEVEQVIRSVSNWPWNPEQAVLCAFRPNVNCHLSRDDKLATLHVSKIQRYLAEYVHSDSGAMIR